MPDDPRSPAETPPPRPKTGLKDAAKAALTRGPSRPQDQAIFWGITTGIKATKELGFPVVCAILLMYGGYKLVNKSINMQDTAQNKLTAAIKEMAEAQAESNEITRALMTEVGLRPPPRDFTLGTFKFAAVPGGTLPHDEDLVRIVKGGLHGTAMLPWDVPDRTLGDIIQYLKTLSPKWKEEEPGEAIVPTPDPWKGQEAAAILRGKKLYHGLAQCLGCHPAYASKQEIYSAVKELTGNAGADFRDDMYGSVLKESDYGVKILPPDFTRSDLRSVRDGHRTEDLYRVIAAGVGGTAMPTWKGALPEEDIWALTHYVDSLVALRGTPQVAELAAKNWAADQGWKPPAPQTN